MITASIVLYNTELQELRNVINSFLPSANKLLYLIDNSEEKLALDSVDIDLTNIIYIFNNKNLGYGSAHNIALREAIKRQSEYHLVMNADIEFDSTIIDDMINFSEKNKDVALLMPKVYDSNGDISYLCKLVPTPIDLILKRFFPFPKIKEKLMFNFQLRFTGYTKSMNVPYLSGCFMFLRMSALKEVGLFDERFFMYPEDIDLTRRLHVKYKTLYYPKVFIVHHYGGASYKSLKMLWIHIINIIKYFNKWGWFFDKDRRIINKKVLKELEQL